MVSAPTPANNTNRISWIPLTRIACDPPEPLRQHVSRTVPRTALRTVPCTVPRTVPRTVPPDTECLERSSSSANGGDRPREKSEKDTLLCTAGVMASNRFFADRGEDFISEEDGDGDTDVATPLEQESASTNPGGVDDSSTILGIGGGGSDTGESCTRVFGTSMCNERNSEFK